MFAKLPNVARFTPDQDSVCIGHFVFDHFRLFFFGQKRQQLGIEDIGQSAKNNGNVIFDLQGRRMNSSALKKGLYITNGKKTWMK